MMSGACCAPAEHREQIPEGFKLEEPVFVGPGMASPGGP
jgi:hypothetical protein